MHGGSLDARCKKLRYTRTIPVESCCLSAYFGPEFPMIRRFFLIAVMLFSAALVLGTACKPKPASDESTEDLSNVPASEENTENSAEDAHAAAEDGDAEDVDPVIELSAPDNALLGGQGLRNPQEKTQDDADSGLKLQLGGGSGYGYQRSRPSLLND